MATTTFVDQETIIEAAWANDVDAAVYDVLDSPASAAEARTALGLVIGTDVQAFGDYQLRGDYNFNYLADTGAANAYVITPSPAISAYTAGDAFWVNISTANTGASTLNVNALGTKAIQRNGAALAGGELRASRIVPLVYDGTQFQLLGESTIIQTATTQVTTRTSGTNVVPDVTTIPQLSELNLIMSAGAFTPKSANSQLLVEFVGLFSLSLTAHIVVSIFKDSETAAISTTMEFDATANGGHTISLRHTLASPGTSAITFKIYAGLDTAGTMYFNQNSSAAEWFGASQAGGRITITEHI